MAKKVIKEDNAAKATTAAAKAPKATKPKAPNAAKPKAEPKPKAAPSPQLTKEEMQSAIYTAVKAAVLEIKAAEPAPEIKVELPQPPKQEPKKIKKSGDERLLTFFAYLYLVIGLVAAVACMVGGIILEINEDSFMSQYIDGPDMGATLIGAGAGIIVSTLVQYTVLKLFVNISHRLTSLDEK